MSLLVFYEYLCRCVLSFCLNEYEWWCYSLLYVGCSFRPTLRRRTLTVPMYPCSRTGQQCFLPVFLLITHGDWKSQLWVENRHQMTTLQSLRNSDCRALFGQFVSVTFRAIVRRHVCDGEQQQTSFPSWIVRARRTSTSLHHHYPSKFWRRADKNCTPQQRGRCQSWKHARPAVN